MPLSGSGTISCPYHGWTYAGADGQCVAKLMEGPEAKMPPGAKVKPYPVEERAGVIWVFVGDMAPVPLDEDLPDCIADGRVWHSISNWRTYDCNWRLLNDNLAHDQHAPFLHRNAPELVFQPIFKHASRNATAPLEDGKGIGHIARDGIAEADYPGLGHFPPRREAWYRFMKPTGRGVEIDPEKSAALVKYSIPYRHMNKMPTIALIGRPTGDFFTCRWIVPVEDGKTVLWNFNQYRRAGAWKTFVERFQWVAWKSWAHDWLFSDQDKKIVELIKGPWPGRELLSRTDVGLVAWRRFMMKNARKPDYEPT